MAALPSIFNLAVSYTLFKTLQRLKVRNFINVFCIVVFSMLLALNVRTLSITQELFSDHKTTIHKSNPININQGSLIKLSSNTEEIHFKENIFDSVSYHCNEGTGCSYRRPKAIRENIKEKILNSGLQITNNQDYDLHIKITEEIKGRVATYGLKVSNNNEVLAHETHSRRLNLTGEEYILKPYSKNLVGFNNYILSNTFWDYLLRIFFNKEQTPFFESFIDKNITTVPLEKNFRLLSSTEKSVDNLIEKHIITNYPNIYHPIGCDEKNIERGLLVKNNKKYSTVTLLDNPEPIKILEEYSHLNKIICKPKALYFIYLSRVQTDISISEYDYNGMHIISEKISTPDFSWRGNPRVSYFDKKEDGSYLIQIREYLGKKETSDKTITFSATEK